MYPIPANRALTLFEIADHWSGQIRPKRTKIDLFTELTKAWWRGEFQSSDGISRLNALRALFKRYRANLPFWIKGTKQPKTKWYYPDGTAEVLALSLLPVPSAEPDNWADEDCEAAYRAIAEHWGNEAFSIIEPVIVGITLSEPEFTRWTNSMGYKRPKFWGGAPPIAVASVAQSVPTTSKNRPANHKKFVRQYIKTTRDRGELPTKKGLEAAAKSECLKGGRDQRRAEFDLQMGDETPGRGRPAK